MAGITETNVEDQHLHSLPLLATVFKEKHRMLSLLGNFLDVYLRSLV